MSHGMEKWKREDFRIESFEHKLIGQRTGMRGSIFWVRKRK